MPWRLRARRMVLITLHWVELERARSVVPPELTIIQFLPGKTIGGLFLAEYGPGSDLQYNELIVGGAAVWHQRRPAVWTTHLFVDNPRSLEGGRALLGAPKYLARFSRSTGSANRVVISTEEGIVCEVSYGRQLWLWRQRVRLAALHRDVRDESEQTISVHGNELRARWGITAAKTKIPHTSPVADRDFGDPLLGLCGKDLDAVLGGAPFLPVQAHTVSSRRTA
jgi:acetoacetate decarboxylase